MNLNVTFAQHGPCTSCGAGAGGGINLVVGGQHLMLCRQCWAQLEELAHRALGE